MGEGKNENFQGNNRPCYKSRKIKHYKIQQIREK